MNQRTPENRYRCTGGSRQLGLMRRSLWLAVLGLLLRPRLPVAGSAASWHNRGLRLADRARWSAAARAFGRSARLDPADGTTRRLLGDAVRERTLRACGPCVASAYLASAPHYAAAARLSPESTSALTHLALDARWVTQPLPPAPARRFGREPVPLGFGPADLTAREDGSESAEAGAARIFGRWGVVVIPGVADAKAVEIARGLVGQLHRSTGDTLIESASRARWAVPVAAAEPLLSGLRARLAGLLSRIGFGGARLVECGMLRTGPGAAAQQLHPDTTAGAETGVARVIKLQVSLEAVTDGMGALEVELKRGDRLVRLTGLPAGTVTIYDTRVNHRGGAHAAGAPLRTTLFVSLLDETGLAPLGLPYTIEPADVARHTWGRAVAALPARLGPPEQGLQPGGTEPIRHVGLARLQPSWLQALPGGGEQFAIRAVWDPAVKYLTYRPWGGLGNQLFHLVAALELAKLLGRVLILPPLTPHTQPLEEASMSDLVPWSRLLDMHGLNEYTPVVAIGSNLKQLEFEFGSASWGETYPPSVNYNETRWHRASPAVHHLQGRTEHVLVIGCCLMWGWRLEDPAEVWPRVRYAPELMRAANRSAAALLGQQYGAVHVRRGDKVGHSQYAAWANLTAHDVVSAMRQAGVRSEKPVFLATDEQRSSWFDPVRAEYNQLFTAADLDHNALAATLHTYPQALWQEVLGIVEQIICVKAGAFFGTLPSTFAGTIHNMRQNAKRHYLRPNTEQLMYFTKLKASCCDRATSIHMPLNIVEKACRLFEGANSDRQLQHC